MSRPGEPFIIAGRTIHVIPTMSDDSEILLIAEAGVNHNGNLDLAHQLVEAAADAGADVVKFQTFNADRVAARSARTASYQAEAGQGSGQLEMLRRLELAPSAWPELQAHAHSLGLGFMSTAFDDESHSLLISIGVDALKVPSGELDNLAFLKAHAACGLPIIASTGMATAAEVDWAMSVLEDVKHVALLHCVSAYPAPLDSCNLRVIPSLAQRHGVAVGWSDHTIGAESAVAAAALGARIFEKHLTLDRTLEGPDHQASADPTEFRRYGEAIRGTTTALGTGRKEPAGIELSTRNLVRRSHHAATDLGSGQILTADDTILLRPAVGVAASRSIVGARLRHSLKAGAAICEEDLEEPGK